ncbi:hypothetical protein MPTK2_7g10110 [Marchantia polymorpha subsp. ruderalis]
MQVSSTYAGKVRIGMGRNGMEWNRMQPKGGRDGRKVSDTRVGLEDGKKGGGRQGVASTHASVEKICPATLGRWGMVNVRLLQTQTHSDP